MIVSHTGTIEGIEGLEIEIFVFDDGEWQVWTPALDGACIGSGKSRAEALQNTVENLRKAAAGIESHFSAHYSNQGIDDETKANRTGIDIRA